MYADAQTGRRVKGARAYRQRGDCFRGSIGCFAVFARYLLAVHSKSPVPTISGMEQLVRCRLQQGILARYLEATRIEFRRQSNEVTSMLTYKH